MKNSALWHWSYAVPLTIYLLIYSHLSWSQPLFQEVSEQMGLPTWEVGQPYDVLTVAWVD